jgi:hypothetical protein
MWIPKLKCYVASSDVLKPEGYGGHSVMGTTWSVYMAVREKASVFDVLQRTSLRA